MYQNATHVFILTDYCRGGNLEQFLQVCAGLSPGYLHRQEIVFSLQLALWGILAAKGTARSRASGPLSATLTW